MNLKQVFTVVLIAGLLLLLLPEANAQCAMCKATAESSQEAGNEQSAGAGINKGILYIMFIPYSLLMVLFGIFFRDRIKGFLRDLGLFR